MNDDTLHDLWTSPANQPSDEAGRKLAAHFLSRVRRRRQFQAGWLIWSFLLLSLVSALAVSQIARRGPEILRAEWALFPLLVLPWIAAVYFLRQFLRERVAAQTLLLPLQEALLTAQASNASARKRLRMVAVLYAAVVPVVAVSIFQLRAAGKVSDRDTVSMVVAFSVILGLGALGIAFRYFRFLEPERRALEAQLQELDRTPSP